MLETGHVHDAAWHVYERGGFTRCGPVLDYPLSDYSVFYEKRSRRLASAERRPGRAVSTNGAGGSTRGTAREARPASASSPAT